MELDELKLEWARRDQALAAVLHSHAALLRANFVDSQQQELRRAGQMRGLSLAVWILFLVGFGAFLFNHFGNWRLFLPALALDIWTLVMGVVTFRQQQALRALDFSRPALEVQQQLAVLRRQRALSFQWSFLTGQLLWWVPFTIVLFKGLLGVNLWAASPWMTKFLLLNLAIGVAVIPLGLGLARWLAPRLAGTRLGEGFVDVIAGRDVQVARRMAARLAAFGRDDG